MIGPNVASLVCHPAFVCVRPTQFGKDPKRARAVLSVTYKEARVSICILDQFVCFTFLRYLVLKYDTSRTHPHYESSPANPVSSTYFRCVVMYEPFESTFAKLNCEVDLFHYWAHSKHDCDLI